MTTDGAATKGWENLNKYRRVRRPKCPRINRTPFASTDWLHVKLESTFIFQQHKIQIKSIHKTTACKRNENRSCPKHTILETCSAEYMIKLIDYSTFLELFHWKRLCFCHLQWFSYPAINLKPEMSCDKILLLPSEAHDKTSVRICSSGIHR